jgi:hypothetical protein
MTSDFNYKKYSLSKLEEWMHDSMSCDETTPQEIYDVIKGVVEENYYTYKHQASQAYELLALLNGNGKGHIEAYDDVMREKEYYELSMPPWGHSDMEYVSQYSGSTVSSCDKDDTTPECKGAWSSFWEENYYPEEYKTHTEMVEAGYEMTADGFWIPPQKEDKVVKWQLPVEEVKDSDTDETEYFITFPDDLLEAANLKPGDDVEWVDKNDGSFLLRKVTKPLGGDEC